MKTPIATRATVAARLLERAKILVRILEALSTPRSSSIDVEGRSISLVRSLWWDTSTQDSFDHEIRPYLKATTREDVATVLDVGAASGLFAIAACLRFSHAKVYAFEPSRRQRVLLTRNTARNKLKARIRIEGLCLWNTTGAFSFRTHGAISGLQMISSLPAKYQFSELVHAVTLDDWNSRKQLDRLDLIKMDVEGAEIEVLQGALDTLSQYKPELLIQAYHLRDGVRTLERCQSILVPLGYHCREMSSSGLLHATVA